MHEGRRVRRWPVRLGFDKMISLEEFLRMPEIDEQPYLEYIDGRIEAKVSPQKKHGRLEKRLMIHIDAFSEPQQLGETFPELRCTFAGRSIIPDVVFLLDEHIETDERDEILDPTFRPPDIHVEIVSPDQSVQKCREKLLFSRANGCPLGWLIDPRAGPCKYTGVAAVLSCFPATGSWKVILSCPGITCRSRSCSAG